MNPTWRQSNNTIYSYWGLIYNPVTHTNNLDIDKRHKIATI